MQKVIGVTILATANAEKCPLTCSGVCKDPTKLPDCAKDQWGCVQFAKPLILAPGVVPPPVETVGKQVAEDGCDEDCDDPKFVLTASFTNFNPMFMDFFMNRRYCKVNTDGCWAVQQTIAHKRAHMMDEGLAEKVLQSWPFDRFNRWMGHKFSCHPTDATKVLIEHFSDLSCSTLICKDNSTDCANVCKDDPKVDCGGPMSSGDDYGSMAAKSEVLLADFKAMWTNGATLDSGISEYATPNKLVHGKEILIISGKTVYKGFQEGTPLPITEVMRNGHPTVGCQTKLDLKCTCDNGKAAVDDDCKKNGGKKCASCVGAFNLNAGTKACDANQCTCANGVAAIGAACDQHNDVKCESCSAGYHLSTNACSENKCSCANGVSETGVGCEKHGDANCKSCNAGFSGTGFPANGTWACTALPSNAAGLSILAGAAAVAANILV